MLNKIVKVIKNPKKIIIFLASRGIIKYDDEKYLKYVYKERFQEELDSNNPKTFNEKLQWLILYNRNPDYTKLVDKSVSIILSVLASSPFGLLDTYFPYCIYPSPFWSVTVLPA